MKYKINLKLPKFGQKEERWSDVAMGDWMIENGTEMRNEGHYSSQSLKLQFLTQGKYLHSLKSKTNINCK